MVRALRFVSVRSLRAICGLSLALGVAAASAAAAFSYKVTVKNTTGGFVNDIHLVFTQTGGNITDRTVLSPSGGVLLSAAGNELNAKFKDLANLGSFVGAFKASVPGAVFDSGYWTYNTANVGAIGAGQVRLEVTMTPGPVASACFLVPLLRRARWRIKGAQRLWYTRT